MLEIGIKVLSADLVLLGIILLISLTCTLYAKDTVRLPSGNMNKFLLQPIHRAYQAKINIPLKDLSSDHPVSYKHFYFTGYSPLKMPCKFLSCRLGYRV